MGKPSINGPFSIAMLVYQRVIVIVYSGEHANCHLDFDLFWWLNGCHFRHEEHLCPSKRESDNAANLFIPLVEGSGLQLVLGEL